MTTIKEAASAVVETVSAANETSREVRRSASQALGRAGTGSEAALHSAASAVRNAGAEGAAVIDGIAETTGRRFASAASYFNPDDTGGLMHDLRRMVMRHPGSSLLLAAAVAGTVGFMVGNSKVRGCDC